MMNKINGLKFFFLLSVLTFCTVDFLLARQNTPNPTYISGKLVIKLLPMDIKPQQAFSDTKKTISLSTLSQVIASQKVSPLLHGRTTSDGRQKTLAAAQPSVLDHIYVIDLADGADIQLAIAELKEYANVVYAEPFYREQLLHTPNDSQIGSQNALSLIRAFEAWDVTKGHEDIIVGVSDTGVQLDHEDLAANIYINEADPVNGIDDDGNSYVDDYRGWDFAEDDNDPSADFSDHGTKVAGISSAVTHNATGMAGVGYNARFVPLKVFNSTDGSSFNTYTSIIYAADQGYDVINLSWGSEGSYSSFAQDVINYAVLEKDMVVVAAAGNTNAELDFYPASYEHVLSVANTNMSDEKSPGATYSYKVDLTAPGFGVFSTQNNNGYGSESGSSFASPHVAGAAALVRTVFPDWNARQVMQQLRVTADDVYSVGSNATYTGQLGKGRLNVYRAVSETNTHAIRIEDYSYANAFGEYAFYDDTVNLTFSFTNYLNPISDATVTLSSANPNVSFPQSEIALGSMMTMETGQEVNLPVVIAPEADNGERVVIRLDYTGQGYEDFEYVEFTISDSFLTLDNGLMALAVGSDGDMGYPDNDKNSAEGLLYDGRLVATYMGLVVANHPDSVSDNLLMDINNLIKDQDFIPTSKMRLEHSDEADLYTRSTFTDTSSGSRAVQVAVEQEILAWLAPEDRGYMLMEYRITNLSAHTKENMHAGLYMDWDLGNKLTNKATWDAEDQVAYTYDAEQAQYMGMAVLSAETPTVHSLDIKSENGNVSELSANFTEAQKYEVLTTAKAGAGESGAGNDVAQLLGAGIGQLAGYESRKVAYAIAGGSTLQELKDNIAKAREKYASFLANPPVREIQKQCADQTFVLTLETGDQFEVFDSPEMNNLLLTGNDFEFPPLEKDTLLFVRNTDQLYPTDIYRVKVTVENPNISFSASPDTLYLGDNAVNKIAFTDLSEQVVSWQWDFGNGSFSTNQHPSAIYNEAGTYAATLHIVSEMGCEASLTKEVRVANRSPKPVIEDRTICKGEQVVLTASNSTALNVYTSAGQQNPVFEGSAFQSGAILTDTTFYVSSVAETFESHRVAVNVTVNSPRVYFAAVADTLDLSAKKRINLYNQTPQSQLQEWYVQGQPVGTETMQQVSFTDETSLEVKLKVTNQQGCVDSLTQVLDIQPAQEPVVVDRVVCRYDRVVIQPEGGTVFYFYNTPDLASAVYKGRQLTLREVTASATYYVTNADGFAESSATAFAVEVDPFDVAITATPDELILSEGMQATFSVLSEQEVATTRWYINDDFLEAAPSPTIFIDAVGEYEVTLVAANAVGCKDTTTMTYPVINVPVTGVGEPADAAIAVYPNPANAIVMVQSDRPLAALQLTHATGQVVLSDIPARADGSYPLQVKDLPDGLYILKGYQQGRPFSRKIIIQKQ